MSYRLVVGAWQKNTRECPHVSFEPMSATWYQVRFLSTVPSLEISQAIDQDIEVNGLSGNGEFKAWAHCIRRRGHYLRRVKIILVGKCQLRLLWGQRLVERILAPGLAWTFLDPLQVARGCSCH